MNPGLMRASPAQIDPAPGWREVVPRKTGHRLLWEADYALFAAETDFAEVRRLGLIGPVECPLAVSREAPCGKRAAGETGGTRRRGRSIWRYVSEHRLHRPDYSAIALIDADARRQPIRQIMPLARNRWALWMLTQVPGHNSLFGLFATDERPREQAESVAFGAHGGTGIEIRHQLGFINLDTGKLVLAGLARDAFMPLAHSFERRAIVFSGWEGIHLVGMDGRRRLSLKGDIRPEGRGAAFHPGSGDPRVALGGAGIYVWNLQTGDCERLEKHGQFPAWGPGGETLFFSESSANLIQRDLRTGEKTTLLAMARDRLPQLVYAQPPRLSADGRYLAICLSQQRLTGVTRKASSTGEPAKAFEHIAALCVLDLAEREFWCAPIRAQNLTWG